MGFWSKRHIWDGITEMFRTQTSIAKRSFSVLALLILTLALFAVTLTPEVHAYSNTQLWSQDNAQNSCTSTTLTVNLSPHETVVANDPILMSFYNAVANHVVSITDNLGDYWVLAVIKTLSGPASDSEIWYVPAGNPGSLTTITLTLSSTGSFCYVDVSQYDTGPISAFNAYTSNSAPTIESTQVDNLLTVGTPIGAGTFTFAEATARTSAIGSGQTILSAAVCGTTSCKNSANNGLFTSFAGANAGQGSCAGGAGACFYVASGWFFSNTMQTTPMASTLSPDSISGSGTAQMVMIAMQFKTGQSVSIPSIIQTVGCLSHNSTAVIGTKNSVYYIEAQAPPYGATVINATAYLNDITVAAVTMQIGVYVANEANNSIPGFGNGAFTLAPGSYSAVVPTTSGNVKFSTGPISVAIHGWSYYLIAISQTDTGSGKFKFLAGGTGSYYNTTALASGGLPSAINLAGVSTSNHVVCISGQAQLTPTTVVVTTTTAIQCTGSQCGGSNVNPQAASLDSIALAVIALMAPIIVVGGIMKNVVGVFIGLILGGILLYLILPDQGLWAIILIALGIVALIFSGKGGGGGV